MKTNASLSIDVEVFKKAKDKFENISGKVEEFLKKELEKIEKNPGE